MTDNLNDEEFGRARRLATVAHFTGRAIALIQASTGATGVNVECVILSMIASDLARTDKRVTARMLRLFADGVEATESERGALQDLESMVNECMIELERIHSLSRTPHEGHA